MPVEVLVFFESKNKEGMQAVRAAMWAMLSYCDAVHMWCTPEDEPEARSTGMSLLVSGSRVQAINDCKQLLQEGNHLWVVSADVALSPSFLVHALPALQHFGAVGPVGPSLQGPQRLELPPEVLRAGDVAAMQYVSKTGGTSVRRCDYLDSSCVLFSRAALDRVGDFDARLDLHYAVRDWFVRLRRSGNKAPGVLTGIYARQLRPELRVLQPGSLSSRLAYYERHKSMTRDRAHQLHALLLFAPSHPAQIGLLVETLDSCQAAGIHGVQILLLGNLDKLGAGQPGGSIAEMLQSGAVSVERGEPEQQAGDLEAYCRKFCDVAAVTWIPEEDRSSLAYIEMVGASICRKAGATWVFRLYDGEKLMDDMETYDRLMRHPDPSVSGYNVAIHHAWGSYSVARIDDPWGDGGDLSGGGRLASEVRMYRPDGHRNVREASRASCLRVLNTTAVRLELLRPEITTDSMHFAAVRKEARPIGLHMLSYSGENQDDIARWLDWTWGLASRAVVVATDGDATAEALEPLREWYTHLTVHASQSLDTHFADWRNEGLEILERSGLKWALSFDPDEWVDDPTNDLIPFRRCADSNDHWLWVIEAQNHRADGAVNESRTVRMHRLGHGIRYHGRVHESVSRSIKGLPAEKSRLAPCPAVLQNRGQADDPDGKKSRRYTDLIRQQIEDDPTSVAQWVTLAWGYLMDGHEAQAEACLDEAVRHSGEREYLAHYERGILAARRAKRDLLHALQMLSRDHQHHANALGLLQALQQVPDLLPASGEPAPLPRLKDDSETGVRPKVSSADNPPDEQG